MLPRIASRRPGVLRDFSRSLLDIVYSCQRQYSSESNLLKKLNLTYPKRTHNCGELRATNVGDHVVLCGWSQKPRKLSQNLIFLPLRDSFGTTQLVCRTENSLKDELLMVSPESVVCAEGIVKRRAIEAVRTDIPTGEIEIELQSLRCLNPADALPFLPTDTKLPSEEVRLRHRVVDIRRDVLQKNLRKRSHASWVIRDFLMSEGFVEVETPILFKTTPEGAREFLVPTRSVGQFYALNQSPQQYKQMLMAAGVDRYFQIARCFRDEDLRADRQPEFTQVDMELAFSTAEEIQTVVEKLVTKVWQEVSGTRLETPFVRMSYDEAMRRYGSDKPDLRFGMEIHDITQFLPRTATFNGVAEAFVIKGGASLTGSEIRQLQSGQAGAEEAKISAIKVNGSDLLGWCSKSSILRSLDRAVVDDLTQALGVEVGDIVVVGQRKAFLSGGFTSMGRARLQAAEILHRKGLLELNGNRFLWVIDFPLFTPNESGDGFISTHHPFTAPLPEDIGLLATNPAQCRSQHYDLVLNGVEIAGGSVRIHSAELQEFVFENVLKIFKEDQARFRHLLDALRSGCPPHGGIALGFDRVMSILCGTQSIRDVIAFPKVASGADLVVGSPSQPSKQQLRDYGIQILE
ncbi:uncharacterized protein VTP21DRAFT_1891 [Calcarisporiella thermophila]|uniref:uncharacterized protein n=1 Tax=Calcarisporiella thermophila TaxID=911321 RepID=UPI0037443EC0